ncbi:MAG TPA: 4-alpha-glucanotransferase, partial [Mycobacteriales bacterium]|nr:4-alpha-glucanotransferase [Mycobacteriales bacterium]
MSTPSSEIEPDLAALAAAHGVATGYLDWADRRVPVRRSAVVAALAALDVDASTPEAARAALQARADAVWSRVLPPVTVL